MRLALIIGNSQYLDKKLSYIPAPEADITALSNVLNDQNIGAFDRVEVIQNQPYSIVKRAITSFYTHKKPGDLILLYFSGHGVLDDDGRLYLALRDTEYDLLGGTALRATFITEQMNKCRSKSQVLILDCCNSGAVGRGTKGDPGIRMGTAATFYGTGSGRVILTATDAAQYAWNGDQVTGRPQTSLFTSYLIRGLQSGEADTDQNGEITLDEIYEYVYTKVVDKVKNQTPGKWAFGQRGEIIIAHNPAWELARPTNIPVALTDALTSPFPGLRAGAIRELEKITSSSNQDTLDQVYNLLQKMVQDDSTTVSLAAAKLLAKLAPGQPVPEKQSPPIQVSNAHLVAEDKCWGRGTLNQLVLSPDKQVFLIASSLGLHFYSLDKLEELYRIDSHAWVRCAAFSPDGKTVAAGFADGNLILYSTLSQNPISIHKHHTSSVNCLVFLPAGNQLAAGYVDGRLMLLDLEPSQKPIFLDEHSGSVNLLSCSPSCDLLASASSDQTIILWDVDQKRPAKKLYGHTAPVWALDFSPDGESIASGSSDENIILWSTAAGKVITRLTGQLGKINCLAFSSDGKMILSGGENGRLTLWNYSSAEPIQTNQGHLLPVLSTCFFHHDRKFISASEDNGVIIWDTFSGSQEKNLSSHTTSLYCIDFSPFGSHLAIGSRDGSIQVWDIDTAKTVQTIFGHRGSVHNLAFSADESFLFSVSRMDQITLWDIKSATRISTSAGHSDKVVSMRASMDRRVLVSGSLDGSVIQWDTQTNSPIRVYNNFEGSLLDISPDGTKLAFSAVHNAIYIFDIPTGIQISRLYPGEIGPRCARLSPDNQYLVLGNVDGTISIYDVITGELIRSLSHHKSTVWDTTFSQSGELVASASHDRTVILWDCSSWEPLQVLKGHTSRVLGVRFSPDDRALASCSWDGTVRLWKVRP